MNHDASTGFFEKTAARRLAHLNALLWAVGNGLSTSTLVTTLAGDFGAKGLAVSIILAAPTLVGLLRQTAPRLIAAWGTRKRFAIHMYAASAVALFALPLVAAPGVLPSARWSLAALVVLWCAYQGLEYFGTVALWSWLGDLSPPSTRGRFLGARETWLSAGRLMGMLASGLFTFYWPDWFSRETLWQAYSLCSIAGALTMLVAIIPLLRMPALESAYASQSISWRTMLVAPLVDRRFRRLVMYGCWLAAVNGLLGASQFLFARRALGLSLLVLLAMRAQTEVGQTALSWLVGRTVDRVGNRRVMIVSQLLVAGAMLFYLTTTPRSWWWLFGASTLFIAYAGLNVGIPNLLLKLAPEEDRSAYVASHYAWSGFAFGLGSLAGGALFDMAAAQKWHMYVNDVRLDHFALIFIAGFVLRAAGALWIARIEENGLKTA